MADLKNRAGWLGSDSLLFPEVNRVFGKENWQLFAIPFERQKAVEILKLHNLETVLFQLPGQRHGMKAEQALLPLTDALASCSEAGVKEFYLLTPLANPALAKLAEEILLASQESGLKVGILQMAEVYGPGMDAGSGPVGEKFWQMVSKGESQDFWRLNEQKTPLLDVRDAAYGICRMVTRHWHGKLVLRSGSQEAAREIGWQVKHPFAEAPANAWRCIRETFQARQRTKKKPAKSQWQQLKERAVPILEILAGFLLVLWFTLWYGSPVLKDTGFDINYIYIGATALLYGKGKAFWSMGLGMLTLIISWLQRGETIIGILYTPECLLHLTTYLLVAVFVGYFADTRNDEKLACQWEKKQAEERYDFLRQLYEKNEAFKDKLYHQIVNSDDSIGRLYRIISQLNSVSPENLFTQAASVTAQVMDVDNIVIYVVGRSNKRYLRQKVRLGKLGAIQPRSLFVEDYPWLSTVLKEQTIFVNRELREKAPDMAAPIISNGEVIAVVGLWGLRFDQWSTHQQNLLGIVARLIANSLGLAYRYEAETQAKKYYGDTRILKETEFNAALKELEHRREVQGNLPLALIRLNAADMSYEEIDAKCHSLVRSEDFIGMYQGDICVLLTDADEKVAQMVCQRLQGAGIPIKTSEAIL